MTRIIILDSGPLALLVHPRRAQPIEDWVLRIMDSGSEVAIPEIALYELRRELIRLDHVAAVARLDELAEVLMYLPITTAVMLRAAVLWAETRRRGRPTADDRALDVDVILGATAQTLVESGENVIVATTNVGHLSRFAPAALWHEIEA